MQYQQYILGKYVTALSFPGYNWSFFGILEEFPTYDPDFYPKFNSQSWIRLRLKVPGPWGGDVSGSALLIDQHLLTVWIHNDSRANSLFCHYTKQGSLYRSKNHISKWIHYSCYHFFICSGKKPFPEKSTHMSKFCTILYNPHKDMCFRSPFQGLRSSWLLGTRISSSCSVSRLYKINFKRRLVSVWQFLLADVLMQCVVYIFKESSQQSIALKWYRMVQ
jgi:hypothetical protein